MNCLQDGTVVTFCPCALPCIDRDHVTVEELKPLQRPGAKR